MSSKRLHSLLTPGRRLAAVTAALLLVGSASAHAQAPEVRLLEDASGWTLQVDGRDFMVLGMNWDYFPIGTNYTYNFWDAAGRRSSRRRWTARCRCCRSMGVNTIRQYVGIPPRWVQYIYEQLRHLHGPQPHRRPLRPRPWTACGSRTPTTPTRGCARSLTAEIAAMVDEFEGTPGAPDVAARQREQLRPVVDVRRDRGPARGRARRGAGALPVLAVRRDRPGHQGAATRTARSPSPTATCSTSTSSPRSARASTSSAPTSTAASRRGTSSRWSRTSWASRSMFTEFGADAFNAREHARGPGHPGRYLLGQWQEIYEQSAGKGRVGNAIGGLTFQWSDGWWKFGQDERLDIHDTNASWPNDAYPEDFVEGEQQHERGVVGHRAPRARPTPAASTSSTRAPRTTRLRGAYKLDPYGPGTDLDAIRAHFGRIQPGRPRRSRPAATRRRCWPTLASRVRVSSGLRMEFETYSTGGTRHQHPPTSRRQPRRLPGVPRLRPACSRSSSDFEAQPAPNRHRHACRSTCSATCPTNPIDEIFYENRGRARDGRGRRRATSELNDIERVKVYQARASRWDDQLVHPRRLLPHRPLPLGHTRATSSASTATPTTATNLDIYNGEAPVGFEIRRARRVSSGLKLAFGPQLWWGANPTVIGKYQRQLRVPST